jgi:hypothetical protein
MRIGRTFLKEKPIVYTLQIRPQGIQTLDMNGLNLTSGIVFRRLIFGWNLGKEAGL